MQDIAAFPDPQPDQNNPAHYAWLEACAGQFADNLELVSGFTCGEIGISWDNEHAPVVTFLIKIPTPPNPRGDLSFNHTVFDPHIELVKPDVVLMTADFLKVSRDVMFKHFGIAGEDKADAPLQ